MNRTFKAAIAALMLAVSLAGSVAAGPFDDAKGAYQHSDYATAMRIWLSLAAQGNADAQFILGSMYADGDGVPRDDAAAVKWYREAADQGHADAQVNLGRMYSVGVSRWIMRRR